MREKKTKKTIHTVVETKKRERHFYQPLSLLWARS